MQSLTCGNHHHRLNQSSSTPWIPLQHTKKFKLPEQPDLRVALSQLQRSGIDRVSSSNEKMASEGGEAGSKSRAYSVSLNQDQFYDEAFKLFQRGLNMPPASKRVHDNTNLCLPGPPGKVLLSPFEQGAAAPRSPTPQSIGKPQGANSLCHGGSLDYSTWSTRHVRRQTTFRLDPCNITP